MTAVTFSCITSCLSTLSDCTEVRVSGADSEADGIYHRAAHHVTVAWAPDMPVYESMIHGNMRYLFSSGTGWTIGHTLDSQTGMYSSGGECFPLFPV